jgi:hypothetical protein
MKIYLICALASSNEKMMVKNKSMHMPQEELLARYPSRV